MQKQEADSDFFNQSLSSASGMYDRSSQHQICEIITGKDSAGSVNETMLYLWRQNGSLDGLTFVVALPFFESE
jgi:hypothetical protein